MIDEIHYQLVKMKIPHICHYGNPYSITDLAMAAITCTECRISRGEISLADIVLKRVDPCDVNQAIELYSKQAREERGLREKGLLPKHAIYPAGTAEKPYVRFTCLIGSRASGPVTDDRKCFSCGGSIDE